MVLHLTDNQEISDNGNCAWPVGRDSISSIAGSSPAILPMFNIIGKTTDGRYVVSGLAKMYYETGLPLSIIFDKCKEKNYQISWPALIEELKSNGMKPDRIHHLLSEHIFESYGKQYRDQILDTIQWKNLLTL
jgi:hypothetical protein